MSTRPDPAQVVRRLAETLDIDQTLAAFPGMTKKELAEVLTEMAGAERKSATSGMLWVDGASRGNPGQAGAGIVLQVADGPVYRFGEYLGEATNNVAEYRALLEGMKKAAGMGVVVLEVRSDSELMVKQLNGLYKVKNPQLQELYFSVIKAMSSFGKVSFMHVRREENKEADKMANLAIDAKDSVTF